MHLVAEVQLGELVHAVPVLGAVDHVGQHQRVVIRREVEAGAREDAEVVFEVVPDFQDRWVGEDRP